jgi:ABC-2 type transport system ATP-binding protein
MGAALEIRDLTKRYGNVVGIQGLTLDLAPGEVLGFLGPNGAGKTTTIRVVLDLLRPTEGSVRVLGLDARKGSVAIRRRLGYLPGDLALYERLTARDLLGWFARLRGGVEQERIDALAARLELDLDRPIRALSSGNRQKVGVLQAFMHDPDVLVLDEPTTELDPLMQAVVHELVREAAAGGAAVFFSSHQLAEVERIADRVAIIRRGELVAVDTVAALRARAPRIFEVRFARAVDHALFEALDPVRSVEGDGGVLRLVVDGPVDALVKELARHEVVELLAREPDLEEIFMAYYRGGGDG